MFRMTVAVFRKSVVNFLFDSWPKIDDTATDTDTLIGRADDKILNILDQVVIYNR